MLCAMTAIRAPLIRAPRRPTASTLRSRMEKLAPAAPSTSAWPETVPAFRRAKTRSVAPTVVACRAASVTTTSYVRSIAASIPSAFTTSNRSRAYSMASAWHQARSTPTIPAGNASRRSPSRNGPHWKTAPRVVRERSATWVNAARQRTIARAWCVVMTAATALAGSAPSMPVLSATTVRALVPSIVTARNVAMTAVAEAAGSRTVVWRRPAITACAAVVRRMVAQRTAVTGPMKCREHVGGTGRRRPSRVKVTRRWAFNSAPARCATTASTPTYSFVVFVMRRCVNRGLYPQPCAPARGTPAPAVTTSLHGSEAMPSRSEPWPLKRRRSEVGSGLEGCTIWSAVGPAAARVMHRMCL